MLHEAAGLTRDESQVVPAYLAQTGPSPKFRDLLGHYLGRGRRQEISIWRCFSPWYGEAAFQVHHGIPALGRVSAQHYCVIVRRYHYGTMTLPTPQKTARVQCASRK